MVNGWGSRPIRHAAPLGSSGIPHSTQSAIVGTPWPDFAGSWIAPTALPAISPATAPRWDCGATAIPLIPFIIVANSGKLWNCDGAVHEPLGVPVVNTACVRSVMKILLVD